MYVGARGCRGCGRVVAPVPELRLDPFEAFGGALTGTILQVAPNRLIVQSWRSTEFAKRDIDSTLILSFWPDGSGGRIELTHVNVPDSDFAGVSEGWSRYYWIPWRTHLEGSSRSNSRKRAK